VGDRTVCRPVFQAFHQTVISTAVFGKSLKINLNSLPHIQNNGAFRTNA